MPLSRGLRGPGHVSIGRDEASPSLVRPQDPRPLAESYTPKDFDDEISTIPGSLERTPPPSVFGTSSASTC
jgi:hypothetical protein